MSLSYRALPFHSFIRSLISGTFYLQISIRKHPILATIDYLLWCQKFHISPLPFLPQNSDLLPIILRHVHAEVDGFRSRDWRAISYAGLLCISPLEHFFNLLKFGQSPELFISDLVQPTNFNYAHQTGICLGRLGCLRFREICLNSAFYICTAPPSFDNYVPT